MWTADATWTRYTSTLDARFAVLSPEPGTFVLVGPDTFTPLYGEGGLFTALDIAESVLRGSHDLPVR